MVNVETLLIGAIMQTRDLKSAVREGLLPAHFGLHRERVAYEFLLRYAEENNGDLPTTEIFLERSGYSDLVSQAKATSPSGLAKQVIQQSKVRKVEQIIPDVDDIRRDPDAVMRRMSAKIREIMVTHGDKTAVPLATGIDLAIEQLTKGKGIRGLPYPWDAFNEVSLGMRGGDLIVIYGRPGCMKTWLLCAFAVHNVRESPGINILFYSVEEEVKEIYPRILTLLLRKDYSLVRAGRIDDDDRETLAFYKEALEAEGTVGNLHVVHPEDTSMVELTRQVDELKPGLLLIDQAQLLSADESLETRDSANVAKVCKALRDLSKSLDIPVVMTVWARRAKSESVGPGGGDDVGYSDVLSQEARVLMRLYPYTDEDDSTDKLLVQVSKARNFRTGGLVMTPPPTGSYADQMMLNNPAAVDIMLLKIDKQGKKAKRVTNLQTDRFAAQKDQPVTQPAPAQQVEPTGGTALKPRRIETEDRDGERDEGAVQADPSGKDPQLP